MGPALMSPPASVAPVAEASSVTPPRRSMNSSSPKSGGTVIAT